MYATGVKVYTCTLYSACTDASTNHAGKPTGRDERNVDMKIGRNDKHLEKEGASIWRKSGNKSQ